MTEMYTQQLLDHYQHPRNRGRLEPADSKGDSRVISAEEYNPLCGDRVMIQARIESGRVVEARFDGRGCALCLGAASILTEMIKGRDLEDLQSLGQAEFLEVLEAPIRPSRLKCALLPWVAFRQAAFGEDDWPH
jgi:nitrogen fixation NifU-like protein